MKVEIESVDKQDRLPLRAFMHSIRRTALHVHPEIELLLILKGTVSVRIAGGAILAGAGDVVLVNSNEPHLSQDEGGENVVLAVQLDRALLGRYDEALARCRFAFNEAYRHEPDARAFDSVRGLCARLYRETRFKNVGYQLAAEGLALELAALLLRHFEAAPGAAPEDEDAERRTPDAEAALFYARINRIVAYVESRYRERLSLAELARREGLNMTYLSRFFKEKTGYSFTEFIQFIRLKKSLDALESSGRKVLDIALDCGFPSAKAYNLVFKRAYGKTPSEWREDRRREAAENAEPERERDAYGSHDAADALSLLRRHLGT